MTGATAMLFDGWIASMRLIIFRLMIFYPEAGLAVPFPIDEKEPKI